MSEISKDARFKKLWNDFIKSMTKLQIAIRKDGGLMEVDIKVSPGKRKRRQSTSGSVTEGK